MMKICFQKSASAVGLGTLLILCLTVITVLAQSKYAERAYDAATHAAATEVLKEINRTPDRAIPRSVFNTEAIGVFPFISSESGNNAALLAPEGIAALSKEFVGRTDLRSHADLEVVPAAATLPGKAVAAAKPAALAVVKVSMRNMQFYPQSLKVKKGAVVEWKNDGFVAHTATSASFDSGSLGPGKSWRHTFTKAGEFPYACTFHPTMTGVVIVK
jgi:plastocyanin